MTGQSLPIFGLTQKRGFQGRCVTMGIRIATINQHQGAAKQELRVKKIVTIDLKYLVNFV